jgi:phosphopantetheinyl transferase
VRSRHGLPSDVIAVAIPEVWDARETMLRLLTARERETFDGFVVEKRRQDWLAGRVAAKACVERATGVPRSRVEVRVDTVGPTRGRPYAALADRGAPLGVLSVSHAGFVAAAAFSPLPIGLDLELVVPRDESFERFAFTASERAAWRHLDGAARDDAVTRAWCMKEAIAKWRGTGLRASLDALELADDPRILVEEGDLVDGDAVYRWARIVGPRPEQPSLGGATTRSSPPMELHLASCGAASEVLG